MSRLNSANKEQRELIQRLFAAGNNCPSIFDREAFDDYQAQVMQPIRDAIVEAGEK